jgi:putative YphP/YqiW family bacilliredoxin
MYPEYMIQPMRQEMTTMGFKEVKTISEVDQAIQSSGSVVAVLNSVCGSAASVTRPALAGALAATGVKPLLITAFAGNDTESVEQIRSYFPEYRPSSPFVAVFRDGQLVHVLERPTFKTLMKDEVEKILISVFNKYCGESLDSSAPIYEPGSEVYVPNTCAS